MKPTFRILSLLFCLISIVACKSNKAQEPGSNAGKTFRILGYYHSSGNWSISEISNQLSSLTDVNLAFINPDANGVFNTYPTLAAFNKELHDKNIRVYLSFGGGSAPSHLAELIKPANRTAFIKAISDFAIQYNFDGVDVDLENELVNEDYAGFVAALSASMKASKKLMTAALASWNGDKINDATLQLFDFINIMSYDKTGPWNPERAGQHSPYSMAEADMQYYHVTRGIASEKLLIGLPFYGYGFGANAPQSMNYKAIVETYPGAENKDEQVVEGGGTIYYNGIPTIRKKTAYALQQKAAGVMIWQIRGDATDSKSLLGAIKSEINN